MFDFSIHSSGGKFLINLIAKIVCWTIRILWKTEEKTTGRIVLHFNFMYESTGTYTHTGRHRCLDVKCWRRWVSVCVHVCAVTTVSENSLRAYSLRVSLQLFTFESIDIDSELVLRVPPQAIEMQHFCGPIPHLSDRWWCVCVSGSR